LPSYKTSFRGNLNSAIHVSESFLVLLDCALSKADKLLAATKSSAVFALDCSFFDARQGVDARTSSQVLMCQCSLVNMKETAFSATSCSVTLHNCHFGSIAHCALKVMGHALVQAIDSYFDNCRSAAHVAGLFPADFEAYYKFLLRWKRASSKEKHAAITLQLSTAPCRLVLELDKPPKCPVVVLQAGVLECSVSLERHDLLAADDAPVLSAGDEEFVEWETRDV
jgi:hypothetical protein